MKICKSGRCVLEIFHLKFLQHNWFMIRKDTNMSLTHVCMAMMMSFSPNYAIGVEYVVAPVEIIQAMETTETVFVRNIFKPRMNPDVNFNRISPNYRQSTKTEKKLESRQRLTPNEVYNDVVLKKLLPNR